ncbi:MAG TPA: hypothetical protein VFZ34_24435 [Blastocatellia bacterium]|nr:hypothetical protein [Blastocatellia bacterium]
MKELRWVLILTLLFLPARAQNSSAVCRLKTKYDRVTETTTVQCEIVHGDEHPARLSVYAAAAYRGEEPNEEGQFWFALHSNRNGATRQTKPLFQQATTLSLMLDKQAVEVPIKDYRKDYFENVRQYAESARAEIRREDLLKLLAVTTLTGRWGGVEFKFSAAELAALKDFISHQLLIAPSR